MPNSDHGSVDWRKTQSALKEASSKSDFLASMVSGQLTYMGEHTFRLDTNYVCVSERQWPAAQAFLKGKARSPSQDKMLARSSGAR